LLDSLEPSPQQVAEEAESRSISAEITVDDDWDVEDEDEVELGPRRAAPHVIAEEEPKSSLRPTIIAGAGVGLAVGIIVSMMLR
jgi:hypothetical protein